MTMSRYSCFSAAAMAGRSSSPSTWTTVYSPSTSGCVYKRASKYTSERSPSGGDQSPGGYQGGGGNRYHLDLLLSGLLLEEINLHGGNLGGGGDQDHLDLLDLLLLSRLLEGSILLAEMKEEEEIEVTLISFSSVSFWRRSIS
jgi:hypothetical protein